MYVPRLPGFIHLSSSKGSTQKVGSSQFSESWGMPELPYREAYRSSAATAAFT